MRKKTEMNRLDRYEVPAVYKEVIITEDAYQISASSPIEESDIQIESAGQSVQHYDGDSDSFNHDWY